MANMYNYVKNVWKKPKANLGQEYKDRLVEWRKDDAIVRVAKPTRIDRARVLGYKAKLGYIVVRVKVNRGGRKREKITGGRRSRNNSSRKDLDMNYRLVSEIRAQKKYTTLEVLNSYFVGQDGQHYWHEVIMIDVNHPSIKADDRINWICNGSNRGRVFRGLTSAGKKSRGLRVKGHGSEQLRPSRSASFRRKQSKQRKIKNL